MSLLDELLHSGNGGAGARRQPSGAAGKRSLTAGLRGARPAGGVPIDDTAQDRVERALGIELTRPAGLEDAAAAGDSPLP